MYGVVTADIVIPLITVTAIAIVFAIMAYLDKRDAEAKARRNWVMAKRYRNAYRLVLDKLEAYEGEANLRDESSLRFRHDRGHFNQIIRSEDEALL